MVSDLESYLCASCQNRALLQSAKQLRRNDDEFITGNVYINPDLTPAEAKLAFDRRERRRTATAARRIHPANQQQSPDQQVTGNSRMNATDISDHDSTAINPATVPRVDDSSQQFFQQQ